ncbi:hypothetical protein [Gemmatimonas aurantiaca]|uniref:hypothetical protein n=1 Tax=Gemmatimonas aurantiaca TaxID=173480 RepID=UPI00301CAAAA
MSTSRFNFTGRKRIPRENVWVGVSGNGPTAIVEAGFDIGSLGFPVTAKVVLEAQAGWTIQRFDWGSVGQSAEPADRRLHEFRSHAGLLFRLKVIAIGDNDGRLLGIADKLKPTGGLEAMPRQSLVVVRPQDLGDRVWKIDFDESQPLLLINSRLNDHQDFLKRREVAALVLPEALHRILEKAVEVGAEDAAADGWHTMAIRLGERLAGRIAPQSGDDEENDRWIDEAISTFSRRHNLMEAFAGESVEEPR